MTALQRSPLPALLLAILLTAGWTMSGWADLRVPWLPDTDDMMRLQQIRDWIGGQAFDDLHQDRLGDGLLMHWSRIGDLVPAGIIVLLTPMLGAAQAELVAVILWPLAQFAVFLQLLSSIAGRLRPEAALPALVLGALAYPATALFMPGRIDHHALQLILVLVQVRALVAAPSWASGTAAGLAIALGATIGLETLPFAVVTGGAVFIVWLRGGEDGRQRQIGFGLTLALGIATLLPLAGVGGVCDTVRPLAAPAIGGGLAMALLALAGRPRWWAVAAALTVAALAVPTAGPCLAGPYASVDPLVARLWLAHVGEAEPLFRADAATVLAHAGLLIAGLLAGAWLAWRRRGGWWLPLSFSAASLALTFFQLRGAYTGAALAAISIAALIVEAREGKRLVPLAGLWLGGAGILYPVAAGAVATPPPERPYCPERAMLARLATLPPGTVFAPIDLGARTIATTRQRVAAAPYHRNNAGNAAMYRFFLGPPDQARRIADAWKVDYVTLCPGAFTETGVVRVDSLAGGARPDWLIPVDRAGGMPLYRVRR